MGESHDRCALLGCTLGREHVDKHVGPPCPRCRGASDWIVARGAWLCFRAGCRHAGPIPVPAEPAPVAAPSSAVAEPARCTRAVCPWHPRDWPVCLLPEGHSEPCDPGPGPHPWVPAAEVEAARAEGYLAGRKFEHAALRDLLRKVIELEDDDRVHYEREVAGLEKRAKANRECAEASRARADGLRALLARVEALS